MALKIESRKPLSKAILKIDQEKLDGLRRIGVRYQPQRAEFTLKVAEDTNDAVKSDEKIESDLLAQLAIVRDLLRIGRHRRHDILVGVAEQVAGQFGKDSDEYQGMGLKKKAEYRR